MAKLEIQDIARALGPDIDAQTIVALLEVGATDEELTEALSRIGGGDTLGTELMSAPGSRIDRLCRILTDADIARSDPDPVTGE